MRPGKAALNTWARLNLGGFTGDCQVGHSLFCCRRHSYYYIRSVHVVVVAGKARQADQVAETAETHRHKSSSYVLATYCLLTTTSPLSLPTRSPPFPLILVCGPISYILVSYLVTNPTPNIKSWVRLDWAWRVSFSMYVMNKFNKEEEY